MLRTSQIYIRRVTRRLLGVIAKVRGMEATVDEVGDDLLMQSILKACPALEPLIAELEVQENHLKTARRELENKMISAITDPEKIQYTKKPSHDNHLPSSPK